MAAMAGWIAMSHGPQLMLPPDRWDLLHTGRGSAPPVRPDLANRTSETNLPEALESDDLDHLGAMPNKIFRKGTSEILNWIVTAAAAECAATVVNYVPCYRTPTGIGCAMGFAYWEA